MAQDPRVEVKIEAEATGLTYPLIMSRAMIDPAFKDGLLAAAAVCRAQGRADEHPCPSDIAAVYIERLAKGEMP